MNVCSRRATVPASTEMAKPERTKALRRRESDEREKVKKRERGREEENRGE